ILRVSGTNTVVEWIVELPALSARLGGRVVDNAGAPVTQLPFSESSSDGTLRMLANTTHDGVFGAEVFGGAWRVWMNNFEVTDGIFLGPRVSIEVQDGV